MRRPRIRLTYQDMVNPEGKRTQRTWLIGTPSFCIEITFWEGFHWHWPFFEEWGPGWHELIAGKLDISFSRENGYDPPVEDSV